METRVVLFRIAWLSVLTLSLAVLAGCTSLYATHSVLSLRVQRLHLMKAGEITYNIKCETAFTDAMQLCALLDMAEEDIRRCNMGVSRSIRLQRLDAVQNLTNAVLASDGDSLTELPIDGTNFRVSYAYGHDSLARAPDATPTNICVVGAFSLQFLIALTSLQSNSVITIYLHESTFYDYFIATLFNDFVGKETGNYASIVTVDLLDSSAEQHLVGATCDAVHVRDSRVLQKSEFYSVVWKLAGEHGEKVRVAPITLIWERRVPKACIRCLMRLDHCVDDDHPSGYARLANVSVSKFCHDQYTFRTSLMQGSTAPDRSPEIPGGADVLSSRILWEYSGRSDAFERYELTQYLNGRYGQIMFRNKNDSVDVFAGLLYAQALDVHGAASQEVRSSPVKVLRAPVTAMNVEAIEIAELRDDIESRAHVVDVSGASDSPEALALPGATSSTEDLDKDELVIFITHSNRVFDDTAYGVQEVLRRLGYRHTCVMGEWDPTMYRALRAGAPHRDCAAFNSPGYLEEFRGVHHSAPQASSSRILLQIVLGPHEPTVFAPHYIAFQFEHPWSTFFADPCDYPRIFADAAHVWCFVDYHKQHMVRELGFHAEDISVVPIYTRGLNLPDVTSAEFRKTAAELNLVVNAVDLLFSGSYSKYRDIAANELHAQCVAEGLICMFICGKWTLLPFGEERHLSLAHTKVVLNIHTEAGSSLEVHRINHLLSLGKCVISERSTVDPAVDLAYQDAVVFADNTAHMYQLARYYVKNSTARAEVEQAALRKFQSIQENTAAIELSMQRVHRKLHDLYK